MSIQAYPAALISVIILVMLLSISTTPSINDVEIESKKNAFYAPFDETRDDDSIPIPQWKSGNQWVYNFEMYGSGSGISSIHATGQIIYQVSGEETVTIAGQSINTYKVSYTRTVDATGSARDGFELHGNAIGTEWYSKDSLELVKSDIYTNMGGTAWQRRVTIGLTLTDTTTMDVTTLGNFYSFPIDPSDSWTSYSAEKRHSDSYTDYDPSGGFYPDDEHTVTDITVTHDYTGIQSAAAANKAVAAGSFSSLKIDASDQWSRSDGDSGTGTTTRWFAKNVGNHVRLEMSNVYEFGFKISSGWMELGSYSYTFVPPPEYGVTAYAHSQEANVKPGESTDFTFTVSNVGGYDDTVTAEILDGGSGWPTLSQTSIPLSMSQNTQIMMNIDAPADATPGSYPEQVKFTSDGDNTKYTVVSVTIKVVENMPPEVKSKTPPGDYAEIVLNESISFQITAQDPDDDPFTITWYIDSVENTTGNSFVFDSVGWIVENYTIEAEVADHKNSVTVTWTLRILSPGSNRSPNILYSYPVEDTVSGVERDTVEFIVHAQDPETVQCDIQWYLDGFLEQSYPSSGEANNTFKLYLTSAMAGADHIVEARVVDDKNPPVIQNWNLIVQEEGEIILRILNVEPAPDVLEEIEKQITFSFEVNYTYEYKVTWFVNWLPRYEFDNLNSITLNTSEFGVGDYKISVMVIPEYGDYWSYQWNLTVITSLYTPLDPSPELDGQIVINAGEAKLFRILNDDPSDTFVWYYDDVEDITDKDATYKFTAPQDEGNHTLSVKVRNKFGKIAWANWSIYITTFINNPPTITSYAPPRNIIIKEGEKVSFNIEVEDIDDIDDVVEVTWYLDNNPIFMGKSYSYQGKSQDIGTHKVRVTVSDGVFTVEREWVVAVEGESQSTELQEFESGNRDLLYIGGLVVFGLLIVMIYFAFAPPKRKSRDAEGDLHCPICMGYIEEEWKLCPTCGEQLNLRCKGCGNHIIPKWSYCPVCHKKITSKDRAGVKPKKTHAAPTPPPSSRPPMGQTGTQAALPQKAPPPMQPPPSSNAPPAQQTQRPATQPPQQQRATIKIVGHHHQQPPSSQAAGPPPKPGPSTGAKSVRNTDIDEEDLDEGGWGY